MFTLFDNLLTVYPHPYRLVWTHSKGVLPWNTMLTMKFTNLKKLTPVIYAYVLDDWRISLPPWSEHVVGLRNTHLLIQQNYGLNAERTLNIVAIYK